MKKKIIAVFIAVMFPVIIYGATYTSYTSWYDENPSGSKCFLSIYSLQDNTDISLYRVGTENTSINTLVNTWTNVAAGTPIHPIAMDPTGATGYGNSFFRLVASNSTAPAGASFVNWEVSSADEGSWPDWHTFVISTNGTFLGTQFYSYLFHDTGNPGINTEGNSMAVINTGASSVNVTVERWNGTAWAAAPATGSGAAAGTIPAGQIWMYGGVTAANAGDFRVTTTGPVVLWKGNALETDNDNFYTVGPSDTGSKIGKTVYGMAATASNYGSNPGAIVVTGIGGSATYDIYYYSYNTGEPRLPSTTGGSWTLLAGGETVGAEQAKSYSFGMAGTPSGPAGSRGVFIKVVVTAGAQIQVQSGQNILTGVSGDGDFLTAADTGRALGTQFFPTNGNNSNTLGVGGNRESRIIVIAPSAGTSVTVASPGLAPQAWTSAGDHQARSFSTDFVEDATSPLNRVYTVTSSRPVYCFFETAGGTGYGMEKGYSAVAPIPGPDLRINMSVNKTAANPGETVTYTITYKNVGTDSATSGEIRFELPAGMSWAGENFPAGGAASGAVTGPGLRTYTYASIPADGNEYTITVRGVLNSTDTGTRVYYNKAAINCAEKPVYTESDPPALVFAVNQPQASYWKSYGVWEDNPPSGSNNQGHLHIYGLRDNTNVRLFYSSNVDTSTCTNFMTINTPQPGFPAVVNAGGVIDVGPFATRFFKIEADFPVLWEFDSLGVEDRAGYSMAPYSTDYKLADNKVFFTHLDYYHKTGCGTPDCPNTPKTGDVIGIINTSLTNAAEVVIYRSGDNGVSWNYMGNLTVAPESVYLYGGATQALAGDYMVVSAGSYMTNGGQNIIVYKGNNIGLDPLGGFGNASNNQGMMYAVSEKGQKADSTRLYGTVSVSAGKIVITAVAGTPSYTVYRYNPASGASASWPVTGNTGNWVSVATGGPLAVGGAPGIYTSTQKGFYKVELSGGTAQAAMGGLMFAEWAQGDGDYVGAADNRANTGVQYPLINTGMDFYLSTSDGGNGYIEVIMPEIGTTINFTGGGVAAAAGACNNAAPGASTAADQALRFYTSGGAETHRITSNKNILVQFQARDSDRITKAFAGSPLYVAVIATPTNTPTSTATNTPSASVTATPTPTGTPTVTLTTTATNSATLTHTLLPTGSPTGTPTQSATYTLTLTNTTTLTATLTPTYSHTSTQSATQTVTHSATVSYTATHTATQTATGTPTGTHSQTPTASVTFTITLTPAPTPVNLKVILSASGDDPAIGGKIRYRITIINDTPFDVRDIQIWDTLPANTAFYRNFSNLLPIYDDASKLLRYDMTGRTLPANTTLVMEFEVIINSISPGDLIYNEVSVDYLDPYYDGVTTGRHPPVTSNLLRYPQDPIIVFPNVYSPSEGSLKFLNTVPDNVIHIYTVSGEMVNAIKCRGLIDYWDGRNRYGRPASPGIYLYVIKNHESNLITATGKFFIVSGR